MFRFYANKEQRRTGTGVMGTGVMGTGVMGTRVTRISAALVSCGLVALLLGGCEFAELVEPERILDSHHRAHYESTDLSPRLLEERIREIDRNYEEPRTPAKIGLSLETSLASISKLNHHEALWRATRACAWLAENETLPARRKQYAEQGYSLGGQAIQKVSYRVESFYYLALCQVALAEFSHISRNKLLSGAENNLKIALALDSSFDYCGPDRALGELLTTTRDEHLLGIVSRDGRQGIYGALEHLAKAAEGCPDYGANRLAYARGLLEAGEYVSARAELEKVMASRTPTDRSGEHQRWLSEANDLLIDLVGK